MKNFTESMLSNAKPLRLYLTVLFSALMLSLPETYANPPMPADTTSNIHVAQIFNYNINPPTQEIGLVDFVWGASAATPPQVYNTYYIPFDREPNTSNDLNWYLQYHPTWIVYDSNGNPVWDTFDPQHEHVAIDISNSDVRDYIFNTYCSSGISQGYNGIAFDNVSLLNSFGRYGIKNTSGVLIQKYTGGAVDAAYQADVIAWATDMYNRLHADNVTVTMNYAYGFSDGTALTSYMDILLDERGFTGWGIDADRYLDSDWLTNMRFIQLLEPQGKGFVSINETKESFDDLTLAHKQWILANYLLIKGSHHYVAIEETGSLQILPEYSAKIGTAVGAMYSYENVYVRDFSGGKALVNPSSTQTYTIGLQGGTYEDLYGNMVNSVTLSPASGIVLLNAPVAWWKLDETSGTVAADSSGCGNSGTLVNGPAWTTAGEIGGALNFDGSNDYVTASNVAVNTGAGANTVAFWMKWNGGDNQMPFAWGGNNYDVYLSGGYFGINTGSADLLGIPFTSANYANKWVHVAIVFPNGTPGAGNAKMYINGVPQTLSLIRGTPTSKSASSNVFLSGWDTGSLYKFGGTLDEVRIYSRQLSDSDVKALVGVPAFWLKLDETSGTVASDSSIYGNNGTLVNGPTWNPTGGKVGGALSFDGSNDYVTASNVAADTAAGGVNTVAFWMKWNGTSNQMPFAWGGNHYDLYLLGGNFGINTCNNDVLGIPFSFTNYANKWVHVAVVFPNGVPGASNVKMYINGMPQTVTQIQGTPASKNASSNVFLSGLDTGSQYKFGGMLDEVQIYNYELSLYDVKALAGVPVIYLKLDDASGTVAADSSGYGHNGALVNGPTWTTGKVGGALNFDGSNDYVTASDVAVNTVAGGVNTVAFWMKWNGGDNQMPFAWGGNHYDVYLSGGYFGINTASSDLLGIPFTSANYANQWVHVAVVFPNGTPGTGNAKMYINGALQTLSLIRGTPASKNASSNVFLSGWDTGSQYKFGGTLDEVRIFNRELSASDVTSLYNGTY